MASVNVRFSECARFSLVFCLLLSGNYDELERNHDYIQWLFPTDEKSGANSTAKALELREIETLRLDEKARQSILVSYRMMLDFFGMVSGQKFCMMQREEGCRVNALTRLSSLTRHLSTSQQARSSAMTPTRTVIPTS